jgi:hypothetical protein
MPETAQDLKSLIMTRFDAADRWLQANKRAKWAEAEDILHSRLGDQLSGTTKSQVFDPVMSTQSMERAHRVMAQLATGKVEAIDKNDLAVGALMNLALDKYVIPNANAQFDFLTKCRMVDMYSAPYGNFFVMVDWDIKPNGYIGADMWLIPIRDVFPQVGAMSVNDSDYIIIRTWRNKSFFEGLKDRDGFKNIPEILAKLEEKTGSKQSRDQNSMSQRELQEYPTAQPTKGDGQYQVLSMFERDRWVDYCVDAELEFRDTPNPHENGELPVVCKYSIPLIDDFMGMSDFERGKTMQYATNSLWNLYLDAVKVSIFPPVMFNKNAIADKNSIKWQAAAKWLFTGNPSQAAQVLQLTPQGVQTFNATMGAVKGSVLNQFGTTDTTLTVAQDPGFGRTPEALKQQSSRTNARDAADRYYMEQFVGEVCRKMVNLMAKKSDKIQFRMLEGEIEELAVEYPEILEMYDKKTGKLTLDKKRTGSTVYDYKIVSGSTYATDQEKQQQTLVDMFKMFTEKMEMNPQTGEVTSPVLERMKSEGKDVQLGEMLTRIVANSGIQDWDKIIVDKNKNPTGFIDDHMKQFQAAMMAMGGDVTQIPGNAQPQMPQQQVPGQMPVMPQMPQQQPQMGGAGQPLPPQMTGGVA